MIIGTVTAEGVPQVLLPISGRDWVAIVDRGFNGDLELPERLRRFVNARFEVEILSQLAGNQQVREDGYRVDFSFDGQIVTALATFVPGDEILLGTGLLKNHRLEIDFPIQNVRIEQRAFPE